MDNCLCPKFTTKLKVKTAYKLLISSYLTVHFKKYTSVNNRCEGFNNGKKNPFFFFKMFKKYLIFQ